MAYPKFIARVFEPRILIEPMMRRLGNKGESLAVKFLEAKGYKILKQNYRTPLGEIDIVAQERDVLCFIEVKLRSGSAYGKAFESVPRFKQHKITRVANWYMGQYNVSSLAVRFDVVAIDNGLTQRPGIILIKNAFEVGY